jgi:hypothetical protein
LCISLDENKILVSAINLSQGVNQAAHISPRSSNGVWQAAEVDSYIQNKPFKWVTDSCDNSNSFIRFQPISCRY